MMLRDFFGTRYRDATEHQSYCTQAVLYYSSLAWGDDTQKPGAHRPEQRIQVYQLIQSGSPTPINEQTCRGCQRRGVEFLSGQY